MNEEIALLEILKNFIKNREYHISQAIDEKKLYRLAVKHKVSNFLKKWAEKDCQSVEIKKLILDDYNKQIMKDTNENLEFEKILAAFEETKIETLVVKGVLMKTLYPQTYMRQMCDFDILTSQEDFKQASKIMKNLGYEKFYDYEKHLIFSKKPFFMLELHRNIIRDRDVGAEYLNKDIWALCENYKNYNYIKTLSIDNAYFFCIVHLLVHFKIGGVSIRDILDIYLYNEKYKNEWDCQKLDKLFDKYHILDFEKNLKQIAYKWFGDEEIRDFDEVENFILQGYSINNQVNYQIGENHGKLKYLLKLFFPEYKIMKEKYPILKKAPILLPAMWVARIFKDIFSKEATVKERLNTLKLIQKANSENVKYTQEIYEKLGIKGDEK